MTNDLKHFGVLGMHWGKRNARPDTLRGDLRKLNRQGKDYSTKATKELAEKYNMSRKDVAAERRKYRQERKVRGAQIVSLLITGVFAAGTIKKYGSLAYNAAKKARAAAIAKRILESNIVDSHFV